MGQIFVAFSEYLNFTTVCTNLILEFLQVAPLHRYPLHLLQCIPQYCNHLDKVMCNIIDGNSDWNSEEFQSESINDLALAAGIKIKVHQI